MPSPFDPATIRRIWVRSPNWLGDFVMATASFRRLRNAFPDAHITVGMRPFLRDLLRGSDWFDEVVDTPSFRSPAALWRQVREMRARRFDLAVVLPNSPATGLVPFLARVPWRLGYRQGRPGLMNLGRKADVRRRWFQKRQGPRRWPTPMPMYYRDLLDELGIPAGPDGGIHPELFVTDEAEQWVDEHLEKLGIAPGTPILLLVVGANFGASKLWMPDRFSAIGKRLQEERGMRALVLVGPKEIELGEQIAAGGDAIAMTDPVLRLDRLAALVKRGALIITGDTGPRHLGVAFDRSVVCLMGPNDPNYTDYCMDRQILIRKELECSPCQRKICPLGHHECMKQITVDEVAVAAGELLERYA
ncbi:MAG: lipopolysaccharide heptosyltransferase II [bacterium]|nr:lipopolysaccharide heptosyltransferase II [bacterium]